ncbi:hypothetical protein [Corynebacterium urealyticum]|uniref:hypothetical protein n=1 Tax=Corynebacterium urealyticum TaxID=43771 RepID=UPI0011E70F76|nr:hypothetical protein [Corynebacterium urealyticum]TYR15625.1 hypothetical protein FYJ89_03610 [Corynebacterium urealyticum]TYR17961.1 hypothetical protein FYJ88_03810 [Corynebacterium urealyticum]
MSVFPCPYEVIRIRRERQTYVDMLGNEVYDEVEEISRPVRVAGWAVPAGDEPTMAGHPRRTVALELFAPVGVFTESDAVRVPGMNEPLEVVGKPANYEHNPFGWSPGLEVVKLAFIE